MPGFHPLLQAEGGFFHGCLPVNLPALRTQQRTIPADMLPIHSCSAKFTGEHLYPLHPLVLPSPPILPLPQQTGELMDMIPDLVEERN
jgi:hypothetical protein